MWRIFLWMECFWKFLRVGCHTIISTNGQECLSEDVFPRDLKMGKTAQIKDNKSTLVSKYIRQDTVWSLEQQTCHRAGLLISHWLFLYKMKEKKLFSIKECKLIVLFSFIPLLFYCSRSRCHRCGKTVNNNRLSLVNFSPVPGTIL